MTPPGIRLLRPLSLALENETWVGDLDGMKVLVKRYCPRPDARVFPIPDTALLFTIVHPLIQRLLWSGSDEDGATVHVLEWLPGVPLAEAMRTPSNPGGLPSRSITGLLADGLAALKYLHLRGDRPHLLHGDVTPSNMLVDAGPDRPTMRLVDVMAIPAGTRLSGRPDVTLGSLYFIPDEVLEGAPPETSSEVWSLAAAVASACGAVLPWNGADSPSGVLAARRNLRPEDYLDLPADLPSGLGCLLTAMLESDPTRRPDAARALSILEELTD